MKIALYKNIKYDYESVIIISDDSTIEYYDKDSEHIRISEFVDIDFPMLNVDLTAAKVAVIDKDIQKAKAGIELLEQAKAELLAIPDLREAK